MTAAPALDRQTLLELKLAPLFSGVADGDLAELLADAAIATHVDGDLLYREGDQGGQFYVVLDGHVEQFVGDDAKRSVIEVFKRPAVFGEAVVFDGGVRPASARVVGGARLLVIPAASFLARLDQRFDLIVQMLGAMSFRLRVLVRQIAELKLKSTAQRLGAFLLSLTEAHAGKVAVRFPYDKRLAAQSLGMTPESLSRSLSRLAPLGVRSEADNLVVIADLDRLRRFCAEDGE